MTEGGNFRTPENLFGKPLFVENPPDGDTKGSFLAETSEIGGSVPRSDAVKSALMVAHKPVETAAVPLAVSLSRQAQPHAEGLQGKVTGGGLFKNGPGKGRIAVQHGASELSRKGFQHIHGFVKIQAGGDESESSFLDAQVP